MSQILEMVPARVSDADAIASMSRNFIETGLGWTWTPRRVAAQIQSRESMVLIAAGPRSQIKGFAIMHFGDRAAHLNLLAVQPSWRCQGVGTALIKWLEASARVAGLECIRLEVRATNQGARQFYNRLGFAQTQTLQGYYLGKEAAVRMVRNLRPPPARQAPSL